MAADLLAMRAKATTTLAVEIGGMLAAVSEATAVSPGQRITVAAAATQVAAVVAKATSKTRREEEAGEVVRIGITVLPLSRE